MSPEQVREIAREAYIYGFPMVDSYRVQHSYYIDSASPEYKGRWNQVHSVARVFTPADTTIQTANSDTPYSMLAADLRAEPVVLLVPPIGSDRYYSLQFIDGYTANFAYVGSRTTGNNGGAYLLAGPGWQGRKPDAITEIIHADTEFVQVAYRTQLFSPDDLVNVSKIQSGYRAQGLSEFTDGSPPAVPPPVDWPAPLTPEDQKTSLRFFDLLDFQFGFAPVKDCESDVRARFAAIGLTGEGTFDSGSLSAEVADALRAGMADAWADFDALKKAKIDTGEVTMSQMFGSAEQLGSNYLYRMAGAVVGIYANSAEEAMYPVLSTDADGAPLDGAHDYTLTFAPNQLPPVNAFWSVTMYRMPESLLVDNPIDRYLINSPMLPDLVRDPDGGLTIHVQHTSPGANREANWLPSPAGPFTIFLRLYWPKPEALEGVWQAPKLVRAS